MKTIKHIYVAPDIVVISNVPSVLMAGTDFPLSTNNSPASQHDDDSADQGTGTPSSNEEYDIPFNLPAEGFGTNN